MDLKERFLANKSDEKQEQRLQRSRERLLFLSRHSINAGLQGLTFEEYSDKNFDKKSSPFNVIKKEWGNVKDKGVRVVLYSKRELQGSNGTLKSTDNVYQEYQHLMMKDFHQLLIMDLNLYLYLYFW